MENGFIMNNLLFQSRLILKSSVITSIVSSISTFNKYILNIQIQNKIQ